MVSSYSSPGHPSPPLPTPLQVTPQPIPAHLIPLDLLPRHRQLSPQPLETRLTHLYERPIQLLLIIPLHSRDLPYDFGTRIADVLDSNGLLGLQLDVAVFVVVDVEVDGAGDCGGRGEGEVVGGAPAAGPEVGGGVFVGDEEDREVG